MSNPLTDRVGQPRTAWVFGMGMEQNDEYLGLRGDVFIHMEDTERGVQDFEYRNLIVRDAGILLARLCKNPQEPKFGLNMLAVGTGATGQANSPNAPDVKQRKLNSELARKAFTGITFRTAQGVASSVGTNILDFTCTFGAGEAVGALTEMALLSTKDANPNNVNPVPDQFPAYTTTVDLSQYDTAINYLTFPVINKPSTATMTITWRLSF